MSEGTTAHLHNKDENKNKYGREREINSLQVGTRIRERTSSIIPPAGCHVARGLEALDGEAHLSAIRASRSYTYTNTEHGE